ncbi:MAG TPA: cobalamin biosynthesis protein CbiD, partial [Methanothermococcus okinawensis]|nr:cobalamin biosynthesis protein CbiD [Methanothermococcus okinawensis]
TTGIVRPMSNEAYRESLVPQIDIALAKNHRMLVYTPGNIGTNYARKLLNVDEDQIVEVSNFWDFMIDKAEEKGVEDILIFGHAGKIVKLAGGIYNTHSKVADGRNEILTAYSSLYIESKDTLRKILYGNTTEEIVDILRREGVLYNVFNDIARRAVERARNRWRKINFSCIIIDMRGNVLGSFIEDRFLPLLK